MKLVPLEPFSKAAPGFNRDAAYEVYKAIMDCPDDESANVMARAIVFEAMNRDILFHGDFLAKSYDEYIAKRMKDVKDAIIKQYVAKQLKGEDLTEVAKAAKYITEIAKDYNSEERRRNALAQRRGSGGRFVTEHTKLEYDRKQPVDHQVFGRLYGLQTGRELKPFLNSQPVSDQVLRNWQGAYQQIADMVGPYDKHPGALVHLRYPNHEVQVAPDRVWEKLSTTKQRPLSAAVSVNDYIPPDVPNFYGMLNAYGAPNAGGSMQNMAGFTSSQYAHSGLNPDRLDRYVQARNEPLAAKYQNQPGSRLFNRLAAGSGLLSDTLGENAPAKVQAALAAGKWVGEYGPEAQRVVGPTAQRTAYRYRGVEKTPDREVVTAARTALQQTRRSEANVLIPSTKARELNNKAREKLGKPPLADRRYNIEEQAQRMVEPIIMPNGKEQASDIISYFRKRLPAANLNTLQTKSGTVPPSEGIILDKNGKVITQAVGYGDDWYLPFNLKNVNRMRGGSYIRTRTFGGPTTEDIYTALISGARSLTVVSHSGVYTIEFDKSFKGGRRYNDKAARMVARYGQLLDAVGSEKVTLDALDPSRKREIAADAARNVRDPDNPEQINDEINRLTRAEQLHPKLSEEQQAQLREDVVREAASKVRTGSGTELTNDQYRQYLVASSLRRLDPDNAMDPEAKRRYAQEALDKLTDANIINGNPELKDKYEKLETKKLAQIREQVQPLRLNGEGYNLALQGLREQFPYYIHTPVFRRWDDASNSSDSGYIKPRHLRPEKAWAGYFDPDVTGNGKVHAHSLYHNEPREVSGGVRRSTEQAREKAQQTASTTPTSASSGGGSTTAANSVVDDKLAARDADRALALHLHELARTGTLVNGGDAKNAAWLLDPQAEGANEESRKVTDIVRLDPSEIDGQLSETPDAFHRKLEAALGPAQRLFKDIDPNIVANYRRRGKMPEAKELPQNLTDLLIYPANTEYRGIGRVFERGRHTRDELTEAYGRDEDIKAAGMPSLDALDFDAQASQKLRDEEALIRKMNKDVGGAYPLEERRAAERRILGNIKARHIKRRLSELREDVPAAPEGPIVNEALVVLTPQQLAEGLGNMSGAARTSAMTAIDPPVRAIENTPPAPSLEELLRRHNEETK